MRPRNAPDDPDVPHHVKRRQEREIAEQLLGGQALPAEAPAGFPEVAAVLSALSGPVQPHELHGEAAALGAFRVAMSGAAAPVRRRRRRAFALGSLTLSNLLVAGVAAAVPVGGLAAAAYTGSLPASVQRFAHHTIGAPAPTSHGATLSSASDEPVVPAASASPTSSPSASPSAHPSPHGPDATGPAAYGLCNAWEHGGLAPSSTAYANLVKAAGSAGGIAAYCATVPHPGASARPPSAHPSHPAHPSTPAHPTTSTHPSHPAHPSKQAHPRTHPSPHASRSLTVKPTAAPKGNG